MKYFKIVNVKSFAGDESDCLLSFGFISRLVAYSLWFPSDV